MKVKALIIGLFLISVVLTANNIVIASQVLTLTSSHIIEALPETNPNSHLWDMTTAFEIPLSGQNIETPIRIKPYTEKILVKSLNNGTDIVFLLSWPDSTKNERTVKTDEFRDAVAIQFAAGDRPYVCMGAVDQLVTILQWKADWQKDIEEGFQDLQQVFPNFWVDIYPYAVGEPPYTLPDAFPEIARIYLSGWYVGNPFSEPIKVTPIEEALALGYGSMTTQENQNSIGRGLWEEENWKVVIARKLNTDDVDDIKLSLTEENAVAFAVWDGESGDVGARKSVTAWVALTLLQPSQYAWLQLISVIIIMALTPIIIMALISIAFAYVVTRKGRT
ncbi:MAG: ethylbenzene dehydrogenase-related protein [Candidatus Bathyarchaeia archaeon]